jgi:N,N'-diacetyllegionaminate synthase
VELIVDLFNQHSGDLEELKRMALTAWQCGADTVKIQLLDSKKIWGDDSREYLELSRDNFLRFVEFCNRHSIPWLATPFLWEHIEWLESAGMQRYKLASWSIKNDPEFCQQVVGYATRNTISISMFVIPRQVIVSLGLVNGFPFGSRENIPYLFCVSEYPTFMDNEKLWQMPKTFSGSNYSGFSDHVVGIAAALEAYRRGARIIEKHFTLDAARQSITEKAHLCSFTPESLRTFKNIINQYEAANGLV